MERLFSSPIVGINKNKAGRLLDGRTGCDMPALAVVEGDIVAIVISANHSDVILACSV